MKDSKKETEEHIQRVRQLLDEAQYELHERAYRHDFSKLQEPEKSEFDAVAGTVENLAFGSPEYKKFIDIHLKPALEHHYANNDHHPQFHGEEGINGMNLFSLMEMFFDWKASGERTKDGNIYKSIDINTPRFGISKQLKKILVNTAKYLHYE
jgi:hypothetical protein